MDKKNRKKLTFKENTLTSDSPQSGKKVSEKDVPVSPKKSSLKSTEDKKTSRGLKHARERPKSDAKPSCSSAGDEYEVAKIKVHPVVSHGRQNSLSSDDKSLIDIPSSPNKSETSIFLKKTDKTFNFNAEPFDVDGRQDGSFFRLENDEKKRSSLSKSREITISTVDTVQPEKIKYSVANENSQRTMGVVDDAGDKANEAEGEGNTNKKPKRKPSRLRFATGKKQAINAYGKKEKNKSKLKKKEKFHLVDTDSQEFEDCVEIEEAEKEDLQVKRYFRDVFIYVWYLVVVTSVALWMVSWNIFYFRNVTSSLFMDTPYPLNEGNSSSKKNGTNSTVEQKWKTLREANTFKDFWAFAETTMVTILYSDFFNPRVDPRIKLADNRILGVPRMRQVRVRPDSCEIHPIMKRFFNECYASYSVFAEETRPIKKGMESSKTATAWKYTEAEDLNTSYYWGEISTYGGGGYYLDLGKTKNESIEMLKELKKNDWLSRATRVLFIDFNLYNANVNFFCICKIVLEFPPFGGIIPRADFQPLKLIRYLTVGDFIVLGFELLIIIYAVYYTFELVKTLRAQKMQFWFFFWNYIDASIVLLLYLYIILGSVLYSNVHDFVRILPDRKDEYTEFQSVKVLQIAFNNLVALLVFLSWCKVFKYLTYNVVLVEMYSTMSKSINNFLAFLPIFLIFLAAFSMMGYLLFGNHVKDFSTLLLSFIALLRMLSGNFDYNQIREAHRILGPLFYLLFVFIMSFLILNMFVAIVVEAYISVRSQVMLDPPKVGEYLRRGLFNCVKCCCCGLHKKLLKGMNPRKKILYDEIRKMLRKAGYTDTEIRIFFYKYDINPETISDKETKNKILRDLELNTVDVNENPEEYLVKYFMRRIDELSNQIDEIEVSLQPVIDKVDLLLRRY